MKLLSPRGPNVLCELYIMLKMYVTKQEKALNQVETETQQPFGFISVIHLFIPVTHLWVALWLWGECDKHILQPGDENDHKWKQSVSSRCWGSKRDHLNVCLRCPFILNVIIVCRPWTFSTFNKNKTKTPNDKKDPAGRKHLVRWWCVLYLCNSNVPTQICKDFYKLSETSVYRHSVIVEMLTLFSVLLVFFSLTCMTLMMTYNLIFTSLVSTHILCL